MIEAIRLSFIGLFGLGLVGALAGFIRFRSQRPEVEETVGPVPTPGPLLVSVIALIILFTGAGELEAEWPAVRAVGVMLGFYALVMLPWGVKSLGRGGVPGVAVLRDHRLVTSGAYRYVRHPGYSATIALWLGAALGTLNWLLVALWPILVGVLFVTSRQEERLLRDKFQDAHRQYVERTGRFLPKPAPSTSIRPAEENG